MPRIAQNGDVYAMKDFVGEINAQRARAELNTFEAFGKAVGRSAKTAWSFCQRPEMIRLKDLRAIVRTIHPDPELMLQVLGYSGKEIKAMAKIIAGR